MLRRGFLGSAATALLAPSLLRARPEPRSEVFDASTFGAVGDGRAIDTKAIQAAVDACARAGGGTVYLRAGRYLSGTVYLKSNVTLHLAAGAVLAGSTNLADYPVTIPALRSYTDTYTDKSLLYAENLDNIAIEGRGVVDGQGASFQGPYKVRPFLVRMVNCRNVNVSGVTMKDSPMWVQHYLACDGVAIHGITVHSRVNANNDGIDIDCCDRVRISDCDISSGDDAIVLKSTSARATRNVVVANCVVSSHCNALKLGTESNGGFENIAIANCTVYDTRLSGVALEIVDGGTLDRVNVSNILMDGVGAPIFIRLGDRGRPYETDGPPPPAGRLRNVLLSGIQATRAGTVGCAIAGLSGHPIEQVAIDNMRLVFDGGGRAQHEHGVVPEHPEKYPEHNMFGVLPAYAFYCRHVRGLRFRNVEVSTAKPDTRAALLIEDVEDLEITGSNLTPHGPGAHQDE